MTPPIWLDAAGRRRPTRACWACGREVAVMRMCTEHLRPHGWEPGPTLHIPAWYCCTTEYVPVPVVAGWWQLVPIWDPGQTMNLLPLFTSPEI